MYQYVGQKFDEICLNKVFKKADKVQMNQMYELTTDQPTSVRKQR